VAGGYTYQNVVATSLCDVSFVSDRPQVSAEWRTRPWRAGWLPPSGRCKSRCGRCALIPECAPQGRRYRGWLPVSARRICNYLIFQSVQQRGSPESVWSCLSWI